MFTGIIEALGVVKKIMAKGSNKIFEISSPISEALKIDQSVSHNGVCLTVIKVEGNTHSVEAVFETLNVTNLNTLKVNDIINIERCMPANGRFDGHVVQGHVDTTARVIKIEELDGSWNFYFEVNNCQEELLINKGSVTINGTSLTVVNTSGNNFHVTIIPYTFENTMFNKLEIGSIVNIEYDIIGKYVQKIMESRKL